MNKFYIWCHQRNQFWKPERMGYTTNRSEAGKYDLDEAIEIVEQANMHCLHDEIPEESMIPA